MIITHDTSVDAAYIYLQDPKVKHEFGHTYTCETDAMINIDFDTDGKIIGIECIPASKTLSSELLRYAVQIDSKEEK